MSMDQMQKEEPCCRNGCTDSCSEPKRPRLALRNIRTTEIAEAFQESDNSTEPTILDVLNEDCWRHLLQYLSVEDLVLSERVSRRWRQIVQKYLQDIRVCVRSSRYYPYDLTPIVECRILRVHPYYYLDIIDKFGPSIVAVDCFNAVGLRYLEHNCPDIEELGIHEPRFHHLKNSVVHFEKLKRLTFRDISLLRDDYVAKFLSVNTPEELVITNNIRITGYCLTSLKNNLKSLQLHACECLRVSCLLDALDHLSELTELRMTYNYTTVLDEIYMFIECTPNLEYLGLDRCTAWLDDGLKSLMDAICGLSRLRHLSLHDNDGVKDYWLEAIGCSCTELRVVHIGSCENVTEAGVSALCRGVGHNLLELYVSNHGFITDADVVSWISLCPILELSYAHAFQDHVGSCFIGRQATPDRGPAVIPRTYLDANAYLDGLMVAHERGFTILMQWQITPTLYWTSHVPEDISKYDRRGSNSLSTILSHAVEQKSNISDTIL